jgi:hypothetical protein
VKKIESALAACHGRIAEPLGAAAKLSIPRQTLESRSRFENQLPLETLKLE